MIVEQIHILYKYSGAQCTQTQFKLFRTHRKGRPLWDPWFLVNVSTFERRYKKAPPSEAGGGKAQ